MDKDRVKGKIDDATGRAKRQVGEWTGDGKTQAEGAAQQVKGKVENAWGKVKDAARDATDKAKTKTEDHRRTDVERDELETDEDRNVA
ncbi:MAG: CsbD family protein [Candidatus Korobacteraceae bacterium]